MSIRLYDLVGRDEARPFSPHCWKTAMALAHKGLAFDRVPMPFTAIPGIAGGARIVPVIEDGGTRVADSFRIALYLEETYPDRPTLFAGEGGKAMARFVEGWSQTQLHSIFGMAAVMDIHDALAPDDQAYLRASREVRFGMPLDEAAGRGMAALETLPGRLEPLRAMLKHRPFVGGTTPLFADYIVFGAFQWMRAISPLKVLDAGDAVHDWFERCLDLHGGLGRKIAPL